MESKVPPLITVITATVGHHGLERCLDTVAAQRNVRVQHLVFADGPEATQKVQPIINSKKRGNPSANIDLICLPYAVGQNRWNGHRMYGAGTFLADGEFLCFLDDDNFFDLDHLDRCHRTLVERGADWIFSFRKIVNADGAFECLDDCESLGLWPSFIHDTDYFVDANCYFLPKSLALTISPLWYRKFREPGKQEVDRALCQTLRRIAPNYQSNGAYSVNYTAGNTSNSVTVDFFRKGNDKMLLRHQGDLPWKRLLFQYLS